jgi:uncharacterized surface protein with fasciclin (FAS1) repeats
LRPDDLRKALLETKAQIVHFCGHGSGKNGLVLENEQGEAKSISTQALANLFKLFSGQIKCVVLNACYSEEQAEAIVQHVGYVIGMNEAIGDEAAIKFSIGFYDALGAQRSIKDAFDFGCNSTEIEGIAEYLAPVLKLNNDNVDILEKNQKLSNFSPVQDSFKETAKKSISLKAGDNAKQIGRFILDHIEHKNFKDKKEQNNPQGNDINCNEVYEINGRVTDVKYLAESSKIELKFE